MREIQQIGLDIASTARIVGGGRTEIGPYCTLEANVSINLGASDRGRFVLGMRSKIKAGCIINCFENAIRIGHRVTLGNYCVLSGHGGISIGDFCIIGSHCSIHAADHIFEGGIPTRFLGEQASGVYVGENCWIGTHVTILDGVSVGIGAIIGAGSVVTRSIPAGAIAYGVPARVARLKNVENS